MRFRFVRLRRQALSAVVFLIWLLSMQPAFAQIYTHQPREEWYSRPLLRLTAFQTAQSDCMLLECGGQSMMIDGGTESFHEMLRQEIEKRGITSFKYLLNTHYHEDHIMGLYWLMRDGFDVGAYLHPYSLKTASSYALQGLAVEQAQRRGIPVVQVFHGDELLLGEAVLTLYRNNDGLSINGRSVITHVQFGDASMLLTADIIGDTQAWLIKELPADAVSADILKVPHHAVSPMSIAFLEAVSPKAALITNTRERVDETCRTQLNTRSIPVFYSGEGTVVFETDGDDWYIYSQ